MKKILIATLTLATTLNAFAGLTGSINLKGVVVPKLSLDITPDANALLLPLHTTQNDLKIGTAVEKSNSNNGYKVTVSSQNNGKLKRANGNETFDYSIKYGSQSMNLTSQQVFTQGQGGAYNVTKDITISYQGKVEEEMVAGDYLDTITFTIAAN